MWAAFALVVRVLFRRTVGEVATLPFSVRSAIQLQGFDSTGACGSAPDSRWPAWAGWRVAGVVLLPVATRLLYTGLVVWVNS